MSGFTERVRPLRAVDTIKDDPPDNRILECAAAAKSDFIVTGDKHLLRLRRYGDVLERRLERAKGMLRATGASLVEISLSTGFSSQSHFTSTFRRLVGPTPTEFQLCGRNSRS